MEGAGVSSASVVLSFPLVVASMFPLLGVALLEGLAVRAYFLLGYWPSYNAPDPKSIPSFAPLHRSLLLEWFAWMPWGALLGIVAMAGLALADSLPKSIRLLPLYCWSFWFVMLLVDPFGSREWYAD